MAYRIKFTTKILTKDVKPGEGRGHVELEYEYKLVPEREQKLILNDIVDKTRDILEDLGYEEKIIKVDKLSISEISD